MTYIFENLYQRLSRKSIIKSPLEVVLSQKLPTIPTKSFFPSCIMYQLCDHFLDGQPINHVSDIQEANFLWSSYTNLQVTGFPNIILCYSKYYLMFLPDSLDLGTVVMWMQLYQLLVPGTPLMP